MYPWQCSERKDIFPECNDVESPGCIMESQSKDCQPALPGVCDLPDLIYLEPLNISDCDYDISDVGVCLLEDNEGSEMCASVWQKNVKCNHIKVEIIYVNHAVFWSILSILSVSFLGLVIGCTVKWKKQYDENGNDDYNEEGLDDSKNIIRIASYHGSLIDPDDMTRTVMTMDKSMRSRMDTTRTQYASTIIADDSSYDSSSSSTSTDYFKDESDSEYTRTGVR